MNADFFCRFSPNDFHPIPFQSVYLDKKLYDHEEDRPQNLKLPDSPTYQLVGFFQHFFLMSYNNEKTVCLILLFLFWFPQSTSHTLEPNRVMAVRWDTVDLLQNYWAWYVSNYKCINKSRFFLRFIYNRFYTYRETIANEIFTDLIWNFISWFAHH